MLLISGCDKKTDTEAIVENEEAGLEENIVRELSTGEEKHIKLDIIRFYPETNIIEIGAKITNYSFQSVTIDGKDITDLDMNNEYRRYYTRIKSPKMEGTVEIKITNSEDEILIETIEVNKAPLFKSMNANEEITIQSIMEKGIQFGYDPDGLYFDNRIMISDPAYPTQKVKELLSYPDNIELISQYHRPNEKLVNCRISLDKKYIACVSGNVVEIYNKESEQRLKSIQFPSYIGGLQFAHNSELLAVGTQHNGVYIINLNSNELLHRLYEKSNIGKSYSTMLFNNDDTVLAIGNEGDGLISGDSVEIWNLETETKIFRYSNSIAFDIGIDTVIYYSNSSRPRNIPQVVSRFSLSAEKSLPDLTIEEYESYIGAVLIQPLTGNIINYTRDYMNVFDKDTGRRIQSYKDKNKPKIRYTRYVSQIIQEEERRIDLQFDLSLNKNNEIRRIAMDTSNSYVALVTYNSSDKKSILEVWDNKKNERIKSYIIPKGSNELNKIFFIEDVLYYIQSKFVTYPLKKGDQTIETLNVYKVADTFEYMYSIYGPSRFNVLVVDPNESRIFINSDGHYGDLFTENDLEESESGTKINYNRDHTFREIDLLNHTLVVDKKWRSIVTRESPNSVSLKSFFNRVDNTFLFSQIEYGKMFGDWYTYTLSPDNVAEKIDNDKISRAVAYIPMTDQVIAEQTDSEPGFIVYDLGNSTLVGVIDEANKILVTPDSNFIISVIPKNVYGERSLDQFIVRRADNLEVVNRIKLNVPQIELAYATNDKILFSSIDGSFRMVDIFTGNLEFTTYLFKDGHYLEWSPDNRISGTLDAVEFIRPIEEEIEIIKSQPDPDYGKKGVVNSGPLRLRSAPSLDGKIVGSVDTDEVIYIYKKTAEKTVIDNMNDYWYRIESYTGKSGWCYGAFITLEE